MNAEDWDERIADLHYADKPGYATGHGVSAEWHIVDGACHILRTTWIPAAEVEKTETHDGANLELSMEALGSLANGNAAQIALRPLVDRYRSWIEQQRDRTTGLSASRGETAEQLLRLAHHAADRIQRGVDILTKDADALDAFRVANRAVGRALRQRLDEIQSPKWKAFQLAFLLLNLPGVADPKDPHRETVDLLFFPTGGGKTEAYLGLAAFTMVLRRLRRRESDSGLGGAGVSVVMRYTLRLLTLDQLGRAAGLVCAMELERSGDPSRYGQWPFEIGLWVGKAATPNVLGYKGFKGSDSARSKVKQFKSDPHNKPSPIPLENCPWCGTRFAPESFTLLPNDDRPKELRIVCVDFECEFSGDRTLPIVAVDEALYRRLPTFLIATVDKFASLPWVGPSGALLGGADRYDSSGFYGAAEPRKGQRRLETPLPPPDLIIQDELHLISGPLGTMAGLYEAAIEALCVREVDDRAIRPKDSGLDRNRTAGQRSDPGPVRATGHAGVPASGTRSAGFVLCANDADRRSAGSALPRGCRPGAEPESCSAENLACDYGCRRARLSGRRWTQEHRQPGGSLHDGAGILQQPAGTRRLPTHPGGADPEHAQGLRPPEAVWREDRPVPGQENILGSCRTDLASLD